MGATLVSTTTSALVENTRHGTSVVCFNFLGGSFACGAGSTRCGNACAAPGSKCCRPHEGLEHEWYPVGQSTVCPDDNHASVVCLNSLGHGFSCGAGSTCCGNACAAPGSKCCRPHGKPRREWYPVSQGTWCRPAVARPSADNHSAVALVDAVTGAPVEDAAAISSLR